MNNNLKPSVPLIAILAVMVNSSVHAESSMSAPWLDPYDSERWQPSSSHLIRPKLLQTLTSIDTTNRTQVKNAYNQYYAPPIPAMNWTGNINNCLPGTVSTEFKEWTISRVNYFRAMAGLPGNITLNEVNSAKAQQAALIMAAQHALSHTPPPTWACYSVEGAEAASNSNIALGFGSSSFDDVVPGYIDDKGLGNQAVGHRRWILYPPQTNMGVGSIPVNVNQWGGNALWVLSGFGARPSTAEGTPWPPRGFVPLTLFPTSNRWSFSYPSADFSTSSVTMNENGTPVGVSVVSRTDNGFGDNTIVWEPTITLTKNVRYDVSITGVSGNSIPTTFAYTVQPIDPADPTSTLNDTNGDGKADILWRNTTSGAIYLYLMNGTSFSSAYVNTVADPTWQIVGRGDYNGDGNADLLWRNSLSGVNTLYLLNGATINSAYVNTVSDPTWQVVGNGDYNGDGKSDILWRNSVSGVLSMYLMNGASFTGAYVNTIADLNWQIVGNGDYNGDGKSDILWRNNSTGVNTIYLMNGASITSAYLNTVADLNWQVVGNGDYNGDGKSDILWRHSSSGVISMYLMNGSSFSSAYVNTVADLSWQIVDNGDYNGDGKTDILWRNISTGVNTLYLMNGAILSGVFLNSIDDITWRVVTLP